jgi:hypothetical protein
MADPSDPVMRTCPWCSEPATATDTTCSSCGAALAQREELGGVLIPGVTGVDPGLAAYAAQPTHIKGPSPSQGIVSGVIPAAALGGPAGLAIVGGIAAVAAVEYLSAKGPGGAHTDPETVGQLSGLAQLALDKVEREGDTHAIEPGADPGVTEPGAAEAPPGT